MLGPALALTETKVREALQQWCRSRVLSSSSSTRTPTCTVSQNWSLLQLGACSGLHGDKGKVGAAKGCRSPALPPRLVHPPAT